MVVSDSGQITLPTGQLALAELIRILELLPVQLSYIDGANTFQFYGGASVFDRSPAMLGTDVYDCHSPASHPVMAEIISKFRQGIHHSATMWHPYRESQLVFTRYLAVRSSEGEYLGCLAVYQNIRPLHQVSGEQHVPQWDT